VVDVEQLLAFLFSLPVRRLIAHHNDVGNMAHPWLHYRACLSREFLGRRSTHGKAARKYHPFASQGSHPRRLSGGLPPYPWRARHQSFARVLHG
jgi:hypothetical protein